MPLPTWTRKLLSRRRRNREQSARRELLEPVRLSLRKLEERRVLDVSAAFITELGLLEIEVSNTEDTASLSNENGAVAIADANDAPIAIEVDGGPGEVQLSAVRRVVVRGDAASDQQFILNTPLNPRDGVQVENTIEAATINDSITRVRENGIALDSLQVTLGANLEASDLDISLGGDVTLTSDVTLTGENVVFAGTVNDDGDGGTGSALTVNAFGLTFFGGDVGGVDAIDSLRTDAAGHSELNADITASGNTIIFNDPVVLTSDVSVTDSGSIGIKFNDTVDSAADAQHGLSANATNGLVTFSGNIGDGSAGDQSLGSLTIHEAAGGVIFGEKAGVSQVRTQGDINVGSVAGGINGVGIQFNGGTANLLTITTAGGDVRWNGASVLVTDVAVVTNGGDLTLTADAPLDSQPNAVRKLTIDAGAGAVAFNEDIGRRVPVNGLDVMNAVGGVTIGGADTETPGSGGAGPVTLVNSVGAISIGSASPIGGTGVVFNAGDGNTLQVTTTGDDVFVDGAVELRSSLSIDTGATAGNITFTTNATIDSEGGENNDATFAAGRGSFSVSNDIGLKQSLGKLTVNSAEAGVTIGDAAVVAVVSAVDGIDFGVGSNEITGSGIVLNGGANTLRLETAGGDIRLNGDTTVASELTFATGAGGGNTVLTNATPLDGEAGEFNAVSFDLGDGSLLANEDFGRDQALGAITVVTASMVIFGESITETPGSDGRGPVEVINADGPIDIGVGANVVDSIMFNGSATAGTTITTTGDDVRLNGPTTFGTDFTVETDGGDFRTTNDAPLDSKQGVFADVMLDVGAGSIFINEDIGATNAVGSLWFRQADGGVTLGEASTETEGTGGSGPVNLVRAARAIDIGVGTNVIGGSGITLNAGDAALTIETDNADIRFNGALKAQSDLVVTTGTGTGSVLLTTAATLDSHDGPTSTTTDERNDVSFDVGAGGISINADLGATQRLNSIDFMRAGAGVEVGGADAATGDRGPVTRVLTDGPITFGSVETLGGIALNGGGSTLTIETSGDDIDIDGKVEVRSDVSFDTGSGNGDLNLSANSTLNSAAGEANGVMIALDTGDAIFAAKIGDTNPLDTLHFSSANEVALLASVEVGRLVQGAGSGTTTIADSLRTTDATQVGVDLTGTDFIINGSITTLGDGRVSITHSGLLDIDDVANMQLNGSFAEGGGGTVQTAANIVTTGDEIRFGSSVTLTDGAAADVNFVTTSGGAAGANITFDSTLDGEGDGIEQLTLNAGDGDVLFSGAVGGVMRLGPIDVSNANNVTADGAVTAVRILQQSGSGTTTFSGAIDTNDASERGIDLNTANVDLNGAVNTTGDGRVEITVSGLLDIADAADMNLNGSFLQDGTGSVQTSANITTSEDDVTFTGAVVARDDLRFDTGVGLGTVRFESTLDGTTDCEEDLHFSTGAGDIEFVGAVGRQVGMGDTVVASADDVRFENSARINSLRQTTGTGETRFDGAVTIKDAAGIHLVTDTVTINSSLDTSTNNAPVLIDVTNDIALGGSLTTGAGTVDLLADDDITLTSSARITTNNAVVTITADADSIADPGSGGAVTLADGSSINSGSANINISADEAITLGRLVTAGVVSITSASGAIVDGGDSGGADIKADQTALRANSGIGTANPIDTQVNTLAAHNELAGGVRVENSGPATLTIGNIGTLSGVSGGPSSAPAKLGGDIEIIHVGAIDIEAPVLNDAGGHTTIRAELNGDLTVNQPVQNRGGNGWIFLFSGEDLIINDSLPEPQAEISTENEGAIRGTAQREVIVDNSETDYVIVRTHSERSIREDNLGQLSPEFDDPSRFPADQRTDFYRKLDTELTTIREEVAPQITNVAPLLTIEAVDQGGSDINSRGQGILKITLGDGFHLERNFHITVDWGDGTIDNYTIPGAPQSSLGFFSSEGLITFSSPNATITPRLDSGELNAEGVREPGVYFVHHTYLSNPNTDDPAALIPVRVDARYDARSEGESILDIGSPVTGSSIFNGIRFIANGSQELFATADEGLSNPGSGVFFFVKVIESVIIPVESRESTEIFISNTRSVSNVSTSGDFEFTVATFEGESFDEYRLFMKVVDDVADEEGREEYPLGLVRLDDPLSLFRERTFPNGHYRIYLEEVRTGRVRLIMECHIYEGRVVPEDFREGTGERQPGSDDGATGDTGVVNPFVDDAPARPAEDTRAPEEGDGANFESDEELHTSRLATSMVLPLAAAAIPWRKRVRRAIESNDRPISRAALRLRRLRRDRRDD